MCQFHMNFKGRPVSAVRSTSISDNLRGKGVIIPSWDMKYNFYVEFEHH